MGSVLAFGFSVISFIAYAVLRGVASLLTMALAVYVWKRIARCRGTFVVRPATLLYFPVVAVVLLAVFAAVDGIRLLTVISPGVFFGVLLTVLLVVPGGMLAGFLTGGMTHLYQTRWGRVMMVSTGNYLIFWFAMTILAVVFLILPYGWLAIPTAGVMLFATVQLVTAHVILYGRYKELQHKATARVPGPPIDLTLDARAAALVACGMDLWAKTGGQAAPRAAFAAALQQQARPQGDYAFTATPAVAAAWQALAADGTALDAALQNLVTRGIVRDGFVPGEQLARLLQTGIMARTLTFARTEFSADGRLAERQQHAVLVQAGGSNLLCTQDEETLRLREVGGPELLALLAALWLPAT